MDFDYYARPQIIVAKTLAGDHKDTSNVLVKQFIAYHGYVVDLSTGKGMNLDDFELQYGFWDLNEISWKKITLKI